MNRRNFFSLFAALALLAGSAFAAPAGSVLLVVAHPDDEYYCAATVYRMAVQLGFTVDEAILTDGEGGYRYSTLAERVYGVELTREAEGRRALPDIRKQEALNAGKILGIRNHYFFNQKDEKFTTDINEGLTHLWDSNLIVNTLAGLMRTERYQYVFVILPRSTTHGHHQAATVLATRAVRMLSESERPVLLGMDTDSSPYTPVAGVTETTVWQSAPAVDFDRNTTFGYQNALSYQIVVSWMISEHKSQGLLQTMHNKDAREYFWVDAVDTPNAKEKVASLFQAVTPPRPESSSATGGA